MIEYYKRYILWGCTLMMKIPGYRTYGRFMHRHYTRNFWRTWTIMVGINIATYIGLKKFMAYQQAKLEEEMIR